MQEKTSAWFYGFLIEIEIRSETPHVVSYYNYERFCGRMVLA